VADDLVPATPRAGHAALVVWLVAAAAGAAIWWITSSLDDLTELARTDRESAVALFRTRVLPAFVVTVLVGAAGGALLMRQGIRVLRAGEFPVPGMLLIRDTPTRRGGMAVAMGWLLAVTGFVLTAVPLTILGLIFWLLGRM
jgi:hypothetical protein